MMHHCGHRNRVMMDVGFTQQGSIIDLMFTGTVRVAGSNEKRQSMEDDGALSPVNRFVFHVLSTSPAQNLAPRPCLVTEEDRRRNQRQQRLLSIAEMDEHAMTGWCRQSPQDVLEKREFFVQRRAERAEQAAYREDRRTRKQAHSFRWS
ncbi:Ethylene-responsive transcription factor CRF1 [Hordeum vulgare]|nr:Ethylene-responsive transcription factor CRF1 [Hordeum vulgare]